MGRIGRIEAWLGLAAGIYGVAVTVIITVLIRQTGAASCGEPRDACIASVNSVTVFFLVGFVTLFALAAVGAALHGFQRSVVGAALLWVSVAELAMFTALGLFSIGLAMLPGTITLLGVAVIALVRLTEWRLTWLRWIEVLAGVGAGVLGIAAMVGLVFWPSIEYSGPNYGGTFSIASFYGLASVLPVFLLVVALAYLVAGAALAHAVYGSRAGYALLALGTVAFICIELAGALVPDTASNLRSVAEIAGVIIPDTTYYLRSVAQFLTPGAVLAVIAVAAASTHLGATQATVAGGV